jgi:hypothetical protein
MIEELSARCQLEAEVELVPGLEPFIKADDVRMMDCSECVLTSDLLSEVSDFALPCMFPESASSHVLARPVGPSWGNLLDDLDGNLGRDIPVKLAPSRNL